MSEYTEFIALTEEDEYEWKLGDELAEIAKRELNEDENVRNQALKQMRNWIRKNSRIASCRMDARFLLRFLRFKKFNVSMAQETLERYILLRNSYGYAFEKLDALDPVVNELITNGYTFVSPKRDKNGRRVIFYVGLKPSWVFHQVRVSAANVSMADSTIANALRTMAESETETLTWWKTRKDFTRHRQGKFHPFNYLNSDMTRVHGVVCETLMEDEENQIRGYVHWGDAKGVGIPYATLFTPREAYRIARNGEVTVPMRHKEIHALHEDPRLSWIIDIVLAYVPEKIQKRIKRYASIEEAKGSVAPELLPKEYGGVMAMEEMIELWKKEMLEMRSTLMLHDKMRVRMELFTELERAGAVRALKGKGLKSSPPIGKDTIFGVIGNFRKLEVD